MTVNTAGSTTFLFRDLGNITMTLANIDVIEIEGKGGKDIINGNAQTSGSVDLSIDGGAGNDTMSGGAGDDVVRGRAGNDRFIGNDGGDRFAFGSEGRDGVTDLDRIVDYNEAEGDVVDITGALVSAVVTANGLVLTLGGIDADRVLLSGIQDVSDVTFV